MRSIVNYRHTYFLIKILFTEIKIYRCTDELKLMGLKTGCYIMIFVRKNSKLIIRMVIVLTLATGLCFSGIASAREITGGADESENVQLNLEESEENQTDENSSYYTQNVYFTEDTQRYVVVYPDDTYVSLTRNENAENKSEEEVCQFL